MELHQNKFFKILWRLLFVILALVPIIFYKDFVKTFSIYFTGANLNQTVTNQWHVVLVNVLFFMSFLIPLSFRRKVKWSEYGLVAAFFVSLFVEMYGIPLTILAASKAFHTGVAPQADFPAFIVHIRFLGVGLRMHLPMLYGTILIVIGTVLIAGGWITLYRNIKKTELVTSGIYSYSRHPQYLGFILIILGWLFGWHTTFTAILSVILIFVYIRVCFIEEKEVHSDLYEQYKKQVPFFF